MPEFRLLGGVKGAVAACLFGSLASTITVHHDGVTEAAPSLWADVEAEGPDPLELSVLNQSRVVLAGYADPNALGPPSGRKPVMWVHVHKNGGSMMCIWARLHAKERNVKPWANCNSLQHGDDWIMHGIATKRNWTTCADRAATFREGGFTWGQIERELSPGDVCMDDFLYGIMLRDPIKRITSYINGNTVGNYDKWMACIQTGAISKCPPKRGLREMGKGYEHFDNFLVRTLGGYDVMTLPPGGVNATHVQAARALLDRFDLVVVLEQLNTAATQASMDRVLGWHPEGPPLGEYKSKYKWKKVGMKPQEKEALRRMNKFDYELYDYFAERR